MDTRSRIELLGGLRIAQGNRVITRFRTQKTAVLLAYLAYYRERSHPREPLIDLLWPEADLASGRNSLSIALSSLRHQLEPPGVPHGAILRADRASVQLNPEAVNTDVAEFEAGLQKAAEAGSANERLLFLASAVELYGGELLPGFYEEWCLTERERLAGSYLGALHQLVQALERTGDLDRALGYARRAVSADPVREEGHQQVMRLLAAAGQPTAALRQYRELEQLLDEQLGEAPSAITRQLAREIERQSTQPTAATRQVGKAAAPRSQRPSALPARLPTGTVTFLLTDLEGSTAQWERGGEAFAAALASHHTLLRRTFRRFGGYEVKEAGDGFIVAFERAGEALSCAVAGQRALAEHPWPQDVGPLRVRMALHTGDVELQEGDYHGLVLHHASRMLAAGHGGQVLCSEAATVVVRRKLEPEMRLTDLGVYRLRDVEHPERLFQVEYPAMLQRVFPPLRAEAGYAHHLPLQFTRFIGRERELGQLAELLLAGPTRLVTLTGAGGTGKSRLALELAGRLVERFQGAVWFVPLADLRPGPGPSLTFGGYPAPTAPPAQRIVDVVLDALRLPRSPSLDPLEQVVEMLSRQPSLLVLDNFEHLVEGGAPLVQTLLQRVPSLKCLVTSRQLLDLSSEREFVVPALQTPAGAVGADRHSGPDHPSAPGVAALLAPPLALEQLSMYESVQLFIDRAQMVKPDFQVTNQNAAAVAELCNRLEGIPLAIELAAARAQVLTPGQMLRQLAHRFEFLVSRKRDGAERHQTLHAAMEWSYRLLAPELQQFLARLSVFRGGWTLEAAEAVACPEGGGGCEEPLALDHLAQLRECSLVAAEEEGEETRFRMLETIREYGEECLTASGEEEAVRNRHAEFFLRLAEEAEPELHGPEQGVWLARLEREHDNLRAALDGSLARGDAEAGLRLGGALLWFWQQRGYWTEGRERLARLLALPGAEARTAARAKGLQGAGWFGWREWDSAAARALLEESLAIYQELGDQRGIADALGGLAFLAWYPLDAVAARALTEEAAAIYRGVGDQHGIAWALRGLGALADAQGEPGAARALYEESLALSRQLGDKQKVAWSLFKLGGMAHEPGAARALYEESLAILREIGDKGAIAYVLHGLAQVAQAQDNPESARALLEEAEAIARGLGGKMQLVTVCMAQGHLLLEEGDLAAARSHFEEGLALQRETEDRGAIAWALLDVGHAAWLQGEWIITQAHAQEALALFQGLGDKEGLLTALESLAVAALTQGWEEHAARLLGAVEALRAGGAEGAGYPPKVGEGPVPGLGIPGPDFWRRSRERIEAAVRAAALRQEYATAWAEGRAMSLERAVSYALEQSGAHPPRE